MIMKGDPTMSGLWCSYQCCQYLCRAGAFEVQYDGDEAPAATNCPLCGTSCKLRDAWPQDGNGYGSHNDGPAWLWVWQPRVERWFRSQTHGAERPPPEAPRLQLALELGISPTWVAWSWTCPALPPQEDLE